MNINLISKSLLLLFILASISACGGKKKPAPTAKVTDTGDITRPPVIEKDFNPIEEAVAEGETVSFDEWRKRRQAEQQKQDQ